MQRTGCSVPMVESGQACGRDMPQSHDTVPTFFDCTVAFKPPGFFILFSPFGCSSSFLVQELLLSCLIFSLSLIAFITFYQIM